MYGHSMAIKRPWPLEVLQLLFGRAIFSCSRWRKHQLPSNQRMDTADRKVSSALALPFRGGSEGQSHDSPRHHRNHIPAWPLLIKSQKDENSLMSSSKYFSQPADRMIPTSEYTKRLTLLNPSSTMPHQPRGHINGWFSCSLFFAGSECAERWWHIWPGQCRHAYGSSL